MLALKNSFTSNERGEEIVKRTGWSLCLEDFLPSSSPQPAFWRLVLVIMAIKNKRKTADLDEWLASSQGTISCSLNNKYFPFYRRSWKYRRSFSEEVKWVELWSLICSIWIVSCHVCLLSCVRFLKSPSSKVVRFEVAVGAKSGFLGIKKILSRKLFLSK